MGVEERQVTGLTVSHLPSCHPEPAAKDLGPGEGRMAEPDPS
jgi:hypothetical protein